MHLCNGNAVSLCVSPAWSGATWIVTWYVLGPDGRLLEEGQYRAPMDMVDALTLEGFVAAKYAELVTSHS